MDNNLKDAYTRKMFDVQTMHNPLATDIMFIYCDTELNHYQEGVSVETSRQMKRAIVRKDSDMNYVQFADDLRLLEDIEALPFTVTISLTDMLRVPRTNDRVNIHGITYTVSMVKPVNRNTSSVVVMLIYPERDLSQDTDVDVSSKWKVNCYVIDGTSKTLVSTPSLGVDYCVEIGWVGYPTEVSWDNGQTWCPFIPRVRRTLTHTNILVRAYTSNTEESLDEDVEFYTINIPLIK